MTEVVKGSTKVWKSVLVPGQWCLYWEEEKGGMWRRDRILRRHTKEEVEYLQAQVLLGVYLPEEF